MAIIIQFNHHYKTNKPTCIVKQHISKLTWLPREDGVATITITATEFMDWPVEDMHKKLMVFKTLTKIWLETKGVPDHPGYPANC